MREMKDSGIEWIGEIPSDWEVAKVKHHFYNSKIIPGVKSKDYERLSLTLNGVIPRKKEDNEGLQPKDFDTYQLIRKDDLVFKLIDLQNVSTSRVGLSHEIGLVSPAYIVLKEKMGMLPSYAEKFFLSMWHRQIFNALGDDGVRSSLNASELLNIPLCVPSIKEQSKIVCFLDKKCNQIDALIEKIQTQINLLEDYKKSIITEAVTKGLDPNAPMKDSGIEWIGEIPKHWDLVPFQYVLEERNEKNFPIQTEERLSLSIDKGVTLYGEKTTNLDRFKEDVSQYKIAHQGDFVMNSMNMIVGAVGISPYFGCVSPAYYTFYDKDFDHCTSKYCDYVFHSKSILKVLFSMGKGIMAIVRGDDRVNTCRLKVSRYDLNKLVIPVPNIEERRRIVKYLDEKINEIDVMIKKENKQLEMLEAYKKSLIYEYVTGKKEVPSDE